MRPTQHPDVICLLFLTFAFAAKLDGVKTYMRMRRVPNHLQVKVIKWFDYLWLTQKCSDEEKAVSCLPDKLKVSGTVVYVFTRVQMVTTVLNHSLNKFQLGMEGGIIRNVYVRVYTIYRGVASWLAGAAQLIVRRDARASVTFRTDR